MKKTVLVDHAVIHVSQQKPAQHFHGWDSKANIHRERRQTWHTDRLHPPKVMGAPFWENENPSQGCHFAPW